MTIAQSGINFDYLRRESWWMTGLLTRDAIEGGTSIICNVDDCGGDIYTLRQIEHEAKFAWNNSVHIKTGQLVQKKIEFENNKNKKFVLWGYLDHMRNTPSDSIWVKDLGPILSKDLSEILGFRANGIEIPLSDCTHTRRQIYNTFFDNWTKGKIDDFDLSSLQTTQPLSDFFWN